VALSQAVRWDTPSQLGEVDETLYGIAWPKLVARMTAILRDRDTAEEVSQEALLRLLLQARAGRAPADPRAWVARVAFNLAMSHGRHAQVAKRRSHQLTVPIAGSSAEQEAIERERSSALRRALAELESNDRLILVLAASGHSGVEIAGRVGWSHAAVRVRLHRLRRRLRDRLLQLEAA